MSNGPDQSQNPAGPAVAKYPAFLTVFPSIMLPMFLAVVDQTIIATALPAIAASTGQFERASWIVVSYLIASTVAAPIYGRLGDSFGRRRVMFAALAVFMAASLLCAASPTIELLTLARLLQGLGGGGLMTLSQALVGEAIPPRERARYQGYLAAVAVCANTFRPHRRRLSHRALRLAVDLPGQHSDRARRCRADLAAAKPESGAASPGGPTPAASSCSRCSLRRRCCRWSRCST